MSKKVIEVKLTKYCKANRKTFPTGKIFTFPFPEWVQDAIERKCNFIAITKYEASEPVKVVKKEVANVDTSKVDIALAKSDISIDNDKKDTPADKKPVKKAKKAAAKKVVKKTVKKTAPKKKAVKPKK